MYFTDALCRWRPRHGYDIAHNHDAAHSPAHAADASRLMKLYAARNEAWLILNDSGKSRLIINIAICYQNQYDHARHPF